MKPEIHRRIGCGWKGEITPREDSGTQLSYVGRILKKMEDVGGERTTPKESIETASTLQGCRKTNSV